MRYPKSTCFWIFVILVFTINLSAADEMFLSWQPNQEPDLAGYHIYYGETSRNYRPFISVGLETSYVFNGLEAGNTWYFAVTAVDNAGNESGFSQEVEAVIPLPDSDNSLPADLSDSGMNAWTIVDEGDRNAPSHWQEQNGCLEQTTNIYGGYISGKYPEKPGTFAITGNPDWTDYTFTTGMLSRDDDAIGMVFRYMDNNNYYRFSMDKSRNYRRLIRKLNGRVTVLAEKTAGYEINRWYTLTARAYGDNIQILIDGTPVFDVNDSTLTGGKIGLYCWGNAGSEFDNITVETPQIIVIPDTTPPVIELTSHDSTKVIETGSSSIRLSGTASDNEKLAVVSWQVNDESAVSSETPENWITGDIPLFEGENLITVTAMDEAGNTDSITATVNYIPVPSQTPGGEWSFVDEGTQATPSDWIHVNETLIQNSNIYGGSINGSDPVKPGTYALNGDVTWRNYSMETILRSSDDDAIGVIFRYKDADNYYRFSMDASRKYRRLTRKLNGIVTVLAENIAGYEINQWYRIKIRVVDDEIQILMDDQVVFHVWDTSLSHGKIGLYCWGNAGSEFRDINVTMLSQDDKPYLMSEDFSDNNMEGWKIIDQGTESTPSEWSVLDGVMVQSSNIYGGSTSGFTPDKPGTMAVSGDEAWTDYTFDVDVKSMDDDAVGIVFRYQNDKNFYRFAMDKSRKYHRLTKHHNGNVSVLEELSGTYSQDQWHHLRVSLQDSSIRVYLDEQLIFDVNDGSLTNGKVGLYCWGNAGSLFDRIIITR